MQNDEVLEGLDEMALGEVRRIHEALERIDGGNLRRVRAVWPAHWHRAPDSRPHRSHMRAARGEVTMAQPASVVHCFQRLSRPPSGSARHSPRWSVPLIALAICAISRASFAQAASGPTEEPRVEFWGAVTAGQTGPSGSVVSSYSPPLLLDGSDYTSHASQTVTFDGQTHVGFEAGANLFFARHAGLQLLFDRQSPDLEGTNGPYDVTLNYISRPPPDNQTIPVTVNNSTPWPDTTGSITQSTFSVNGVVRVGTSSRIDATLSGGLSIQRLSGTVQPVGFTQYNLGGHSVLLKTSIASRCRSVPRARSASTSAAI